VLSEQGTTNRKYLVLGVGNTLLCDDGAGVHVAKSLESRTELSSRIKIIDGGTLGLSLLPEIEDAAGLIVIDAAELGEPPGTIRVFENDAMDRHLSGKKTTVHEVAVADLLAAASLTGHAPHERALVAIQPESLDWGLELSASVEPAVAGAADAVASVIAGWSA
jgi:hydrogenase maturation protease